MNIPPTHFENFEQWETIASHGSPLALQINALTPLGLPWRNLNQNDSDNETNYERAD